MANWKIKLSLFTLLFLSLIFLSSQPAKSGDPPGQKRIFRYGQYDRDTRRLASTEQINFYSYPDIWHAEAADRKLSKLVFPNGDIPGTFTIYDTHLTQANYVAAGDLENDGYKDIVSSSYYDGFIAILHQSLTTHQLELVALWDVTQGGSTNGVRDVYIADMNGDCLNDIVAFDILNGLIAIFLQTKDYGVFIRTQMSIGGISRGRVDDVNRDGHSDLIWTEGRSVHVAYQTPTGFTAPQVFSHPPSSFDMMEEPAVGDVNGDGYPDLVAVDGYQLKLFIWESPSMQLRILDAPLNVSENVTLGDLDRDGIEDIAVPGMGTDQVALTWGGVFTRTMLSGVGNMYDAAIGDIDDDGNLELVATDRQFYNLVIWRFDGRVSSSQIVSANVIPGQVIVADLNGDGLNDVAYGIAGYTAPPHAPITVHYQTGQGNVIPRFDRCVVWWRYYFPFVVR